MGWFVDFNGKEWGIKTNEKGETVIFANIELQINGMDEHTMKQYKEAVNRRRIDAELHIRVILSVPSLRGLSK